MGRKNWGKIPSISALNYELTNHTQFISFPPFMPIFDLRNCPLICWVASDGDGDDDAGNCGGSTDTECRTGIVAFFALLIPLAFLLTFNVHGGRSFTGTRTPPVGWDGMGSGIGPVEAKLSGTLTSLEKGLT